jgi:HlyD family secretion protein
VNWLKWILSTVFIAVGAAAIVVILWPKPVAVETYTVARKHFEQVVEDDGRTRVRERYTVSSPVAGHILRIDLEAGDPVTEDTPLATILPNPPSMLDARAHEELEQRLGAAEAGRLRASAALQRAQSVLQQARADLDRTSTLVKKGASPVVQLERDELNARVAARELEAAQFEDHAAGHEVELARAAMAGPSPSAGKAGTEPLVIRSPITGEVLRVIHESEGGVDIGSPLIEIGDPTDLEIVADILSTDAVSVTRGAAVRIAGWGGDKPLDGRVRRVEPSAFTKVSALGIEEQRVNTIIDIVSPPQQWSTLGDGFRVDVEIVTFATDDVITVPSGALFRDANGWNVYAIENGRARLRAVQVARQSGLEAMLVSGLSAGDQVVLYPSDAVRDGVKVGRR